MRPTVTTLSLFAAALAAGTGVRADEAPASGESSVALGAALERAGRLEQEVARLRQANAALATSLAAANEEANTVRKDLQSLRSDLEALGLSVFDPTDREARRRLIATMAEAARERDNRAKLEQQLLQLSESVLVFLDRQPEVDGKLRADLEAELRSADQALAATRLAPEAPSANATELTEARVISLKGELGLAVLNVGSRSGVRLGMPFKFSRHDRHLGAALVVDVREDVCGLAANEGGLAIEQLQIGDTAKPGVN